jgi:membrane associated rhomboid family serine protease
VLPIKDNIPTDRFPLVTVLLIAINVIVFVGFQHPTGLAGVNEQTVVKWGAIPYRITHPGKRCDLGPDGVVLCQGQSVLTPAGQAQVGGPAPSQPPAWVTIFSAMFMHGGVLHILGNMLFLWIFGNNVEDSMGKVRFAGFYLLGGVAALAGQVAVDPGSSAPTIGASGAIAAVLGGYILLYPRARVLTLVFIIFFVTVVELPALVMLGVWFLEQIYFGAANLSNPIGGAGGVAYWAHIGGFAFGLALIRLFATRHKQIPPPYPVY